MFTSGRLYLALLIGLSFQLHTLLLTAQDRKFLPEILAKHGSDSLKTILENPAVYRYQLIYTKIDRDKNNKPHFTDYHYRVDPAEYFNPASTVKLPVVLLALQKLNMLKSKGINKYTTMLTDSSYPSQSAVLKDTSSSNGYPSVAQYAKKIFLVSDNDAYNRLYEFNGQEYMNRSLHNMGYPSFRITRRFVTMTEEQNRHTNQVRFLAGDKLLYVQSPAWNKRPFDFDKTILIGKAHYDRQGKLIDSPMNFTTHNNAPLADLHMMLRSVLFPAAVPRKKRFRLDEDDYSFLYKYMSMLPSESQNPTYDTTEFFDSYTKFFMFKSGKSKIPSFVRVFNKTGWSYGFLTDICYIIDTKNKIEFMLSGVIYVNSDGILNDDRYEYEELGYPFFKEIGNIIYNYELQRTRKYRPDFSRFTSAIQTPAP